MTGRRERVFRDDNVRVAPIRGLSSLTQPGAGERVSGVIDVAVLGARADGKTQFIAHAIRTLRAYAPTDLSPDEAAHNQDILQVVMNARDPRPAATAPGHVVHYTFRARPEMVWRSLGPLRRLGLLLGRRITRGLLAAVVVNAILMWALAMERRGGMDLASAAVAAGALVFGAAVAVRLARSIFLGSGDIEVVFWDVAGEEVYGKSASGYYTFLSTLAQTRMRGQPRGRAYGFAPVLICNPLSVATEVGNSAFARLRELMPLFAALSNPAADVLVAINRWSLVKHVCKAGRRAGERVAVVPVALGAGEGEGEGVGVGVGEGEGEGVGVGQGEGEGEGVGVGVGEGRDHLEPLPVLRRRVVRDQCVDIDDEDLGDTSARCIRYDAGLHAELGDDEWRGYAELPPSVQRRFSAPGSEPDAVVTYRYAEGPGSFTGAARRGFITWLIGSLRRPERAAAPAERDRPPGRPTRVRRQTSELFVVPGQEDDDSAGLSSGS